MNNDEIKPIEELNNGEPKPVEPASPPSQSEPIPPPATPPAPVPPQAPTPSPSAEPPKTSSEPTSPAPAPPPPPFAGPRSVIKRPKGGLLKIIGSILLILVALGVAFYFFFYRATIEINPDPKPDKILLDNKEIEPGAYRVIPGLHTIVIKKEGYISYISARKYKIAEKSKLSFKFEKEKASSLHVPGGKFPTFSWDQKLLFFLDPNAAISVINLMDKSPKSSQLSNGHYPTARDIKISKDNNFALVLDQEAIKVLNFSKTDLINQTEAKLPPLASGINSVSWNDNASQYFPEANSKIIYDLLSSSGWDVFLANRQHSEANLIMQLEQSTFQNLQMDWGQNPNKVLIAGEELGVLDISKRDYTKISSEKKFVFAKWGPNAENAVAVDSEGSVWKITKEFKIEKLPFTSKANLVSFFDSKNLAAVSEGRPLKYNFDTGELINYAEVKDLKNASRFNARSDLFYFETKSGILSGKYETPSYK